MASANRERTDSKSRSRRSFRSRACSEPEVLSHLTPRLIPSKSILTPGSLDAGSTESSVSSSPAKSFASSIGGYITGSMTRLLAQDQHVNYTQSNDRSEPILSVHVQRIRTCCKHDLIFIVQGYRSGFQVWDISSSIAREIVNLRSGEAVYCASFMGIWNTACRPDCCENVSPSPAKRARLAVTSTTCRDTSPVNIRIFDFDDHRYIHTISCNAEVHGTAGNETCLAASLAREVRVYSALTFQEVFRLGCFPQPVGEAIMTMGTRWLAVPADHPPSNDDILPDPSSIQGTGSSSASSSVTDMAQSLVGSLYYLKDVSKSGLGQATGALSASLKRQIQSSDFLSSSPFLSDTPNSRGSTWNGSDIPERISPGNRAGINHAASGSVAVVDTRQGLAIVHFRGHKEPIAKMAFNSSGSLLVTAPVSGQTLNVHMIRPNKATLVYRLHRGFTPAIVRCLTCSPCDSWIALTTSHNTTHIFSVDPGAGIPLLGANHINHTNQNTDVLTIEVMCRLRRPSLSSSAPSDYISSHVAPSSWSPDTGTALLSNYSGTPRSKPRPSASIFRSDTSGDLVILGVGEEGVTVETTVVMNGKYNDLNEEGMPRLNTTEQRWWQLPRGLYEVSAPESDAALIKASLEGNNINDALRGRQLQKALMIQPASVPNDTFSMDDNFTFEMEENHPINNKELGKHSDSRPVKTTDMHNWLSFVERETSCSQNVPIWASPMIRMAVLKPTDFERTSAKRNDACAGIIAEHVHKENIVIRRQGPEVLSGTKNLQDDIKRAINTSLM